MESEAVRAPATALPEKPLTLDRAVEIALANNPTVAARRWDTDDAGRDVARAEGQWLVEQTAG